MQQCRRLDFGVTDWQRCRSLWLKAVKASSATRRRALGDHRLKYIRKKVKIILRHDISKECHASNMMQDLEKATYRPIATTKAFWIVMFQCSIVVRWKLDSDLETYRCSTYKSDICSTQFCCKFRQLHFCQELFKLVFILTLLSWKL